MFQSHPQRRHPRSQGSPQQAQVLGLARRARMRSSQARRQRIHQCPDHGGRVAYCSSVRPSSTPSGATYAFSKPSSATLAGAQAVDDSPLARSFSLSLPESTLSRYFSKLSCQIKSDSFPFGCVATFQLVIPGRRFNSGKSDETSTILNKLGLLLSAAAMTASSSTGLNEQVEYTNRPPGASNCIALSRIRNCRLVRSAPATMSESRKAHLCKLFPSAADHLAQISTFFLNVPSPLHLRGVSLYFQCEWKVDIRHIRQDPVELQRLSFS